MSYCCNGNTVRRDLRLQRLSGVYTWQHVSMRYLDLTSTRTGLFLISTIYFLTVRHENNVSSDKDWSQWR